MGGLDRHAKIVADAGDFAATLSQLTRPDEEHDLERIAQWSPALWAQTVFFARSLEQALEKCSGVYSIRVKYSVVAGFFRRGKWLLGRHRLGVPAHPVRKLRVRIEWV